MRAPLRGFRRRTSRSAIRPGISVSVKLLATEIGLVDVGNDAIDAEQLSRDGALPPWF